MILGYRTWLLWPRVGLILMGMGFLSDPLAIFWMTGTFMVLMGIAGVGGWFFGLIDCQATFDACCVVPPDDDHSGARFVLVRRNGRWAWEKEAR